METRSHFRFTRILPSAGSFFLCHYRRIALRTHQMIRARIVQGSRLRSSTRPRTKTAAEMPTLRVRAFASGVMYRQRGTSGMEFSVDA